MTDFGLRSKKIGFIGAGNMAQALIKSILSADLVSKDNIFVTNRTQRKLEKIRDEFGVASLASNEELIEKSDIVIVGVKPQDLFEALEPIASSFYEGHIVISLAAGIDLDSLKKIIGRKPHIVRVMPNTPISINKGVIGYCMSKDEPQIGSLVESLFSPSAYVVPVQEGEEFQALMVATSSGIGFVFELMMYWQEWLEEHNFTPEQARQMTVQTFVGASLLADSNGEISLDELQKKVTSKKGVTAAGLDSMRELEIERLLRYSFEKAVLRDREIAKNNG